MRCMRKLRPQLQMRQKPRACDKTYPSYPSSCPSPFLGHFFFENNAFSIFHLNAELVTVVQIKLPLTHRGICIKVAGKIGGPSLFSVYRG